MSNKRIDRGGKGITKIPGTRTGTIEWIPNRTGGGYYVAKISTPSGRVRVPMVDEDGKPQFTDRERDKDRAQVFAGRIATKASESTESPKPVEPNKVTVEAFGNRWTSGNLYREFGEVKRLKIKASARDDENRLRLHVYPHIGTMPISAVTEEHIERMFAKAFAAAAERNNAPLRAATRRHIYMVTHRLFELAVRPGRLCATNPVSDYLLPAKDRDKLYGFLYPDELVQLAACRDIPLARRVYYCLASYTGLRKGSLKSFTWDCIDFDHATITCLITKNMAPQIFAQSDPDTPGLVSLITILKRYYDLLGRPSRNSPIVTYKSLQMAKDHEAATLRMDLDCALIRREELHNSQNKSGIEPLRFHDLRATFVTWALRLGKPDSWIMDRTGHITRSILQRYNRGARRLADLNYVPFPDISNTIPELRT